MAEPNLRITLTSSRCQRGHVPGRHRRAPAGTQTQGRAHASRAAPSASRDGPDEPPPFTEWCRRGGRRLVGVRRGAREGRGPRRGARATPARTARATAPRSSAGSTGRPTTAPTQRPHAPPPRDGGRSSHPPQPPGQVGLRGRGSTAAGATSVGDVARRARDVRTIPPRPNAQVTVTTTGPSVESGAEQAVRTDADGVVRVRVLIGSYGTYDAPGRRRRPRDGAARDARHDGTRRRRCPEHARGHARRRGQRLISADLRT